MSLTKKFLEQVVPLRYSNFDELSKKLLLTFVTKNNLKWIVSMLCKGEQPSLKNHKIFVTEVGFSLKKMSSLIKNMMLIYNYEGAKLFSYL